MSARLATVPIAGHLKKAREITLPLPALRVKALCLVVAQSEVGPWAFGFKLVWKHHASSEPCALAQWPSDHEAAREGILVICQQLRNWGSPHRNQIALLDYAMKLKARSNHRATEPRSFSLSRKYVPEELYQ